MLSVPPRRPDRRPRNQREERRPVTIIAGFPITGWVVLGADAEEGGLFAKSSVEKIAVINGEDYKCLIGGAGDADFIDFAVQEAEQDLKASNIPITLEVLRLTLEKVVTEIYLSRIDPLPPHQQEDAHFDLLCALWTQESGEAQLVRVGRAVSLIRQRPEVIGIGGYLATYLIDTLRSDPLALRNVERMCAYILARVKAHVKDCGGSSQILKLGADGTIDAVPQFVITEDEQTTSLVMDRGVRWLFHWTDPIGWRGNLSKIDEVVDHAADLIKRDLRDHVIALRGEGSPQGHEED